MSLKRILTAIVALGIVFSFLASFPNELQGRENRSVEIAIDLDEVNILAEDAGLDAETVVSMLKDAGATAIAMRESTVQRYIGEGRLAVFQGGEILNALSTGLLENPVFVALRDEGKIDTNFTYIITEDRELSNQLLSRLDVAYGRQADLIRENTPYIIEIRASKNAILNVPIGLDENDVALAQNAALSIVGRPANIHMGTESALRAVLGEYASLPENLLSALVFDGIEAAGFPDYLDVAGEILNENNMRVGFVELVRRQAGIESLMRQTGYRSVIVHSNIKGRPVASIVNAVKERGARLLYVRFHIDKRPAALDERVEFLEEVNQTLAGYGFFSGRSTPFRESPFASGTFFILSLLGVCAGALLLFIHLKLKLNLFAVASTIALLLMLSALYFLSSDLARQMAAILAAIVFSSLIFITQVANRLPYRGKSIPLFVFYTLARVFVLSILGGVVIAGFNSTLVFTSGAALFRGVTLTNILPFIPIAWVLYLNQKGIIFERDAMPALLSLVKHLQNPVKWLQMLLLTAAGAIVFVYITRMGNQAAVPLFPFEEAMRRFLDDVLLVRPRTKEFLIAYPALILGLVILAKNAKNLLGYVLIFVGALAPVSIINTFMHFTNPTLLSSAALRSFNGLWLGAVIAVLFYYVFMIGFKLIKKWGKVLWN